MKNTEDVKQGSVLMCYIHAETFLKRIRGAFVYKIDIDVCFGLWHN